MSKIKKIFVGTLIGASIFSVNAFANSKIPGGSVILGDKSFSLEYANDKKNEQEIRQAMLDADTIYIKLVSGYYVDNLTANKVNESVIKATTYKDENGVINVSDENNTSEDLEVISIE